jgi:hypothetical protein
MVRPSRFKTFTLVIRSPTRTLTLAALDRAIAAARPVPVRPQSRHEIGGDEPARTSTYERAHAELQAQGQDLGEATADVQHFRPRFCSTGWVLCALPGYQPVAVPEPIWQAVIHAASARTTAYRWPPLGSPAGERDRPVSMDTEATRVRLAGGTWGSGHLVRDTPGSDRRWEPDVGFSTNITPANRYWMGPETPQLRVRVGATLPYARAQNLSIATDPRRALEQALPSSCCGS